MVEVEIDGQKVEVPEGSMVMHACSKLGTYVPHFCYHPKLSIAANCRMCLVDVEKAPKPMPACATPVSQGMIVRTKSDKAINAQKGVMEFLLINHPLDCPICDQGGECQLQDLAVGYGASASRYTEEKRVVFHKDVGPLISMEEMSRCIHCTRCVRFGQEVAGVMELGMAHRGEHSEITTFVGMSVDSELSGNMIDICPVGALTSKPFRYSARTWELSRRKSVSPHDSTGANLVVQVKQNKVMRVVPLENELVNECWISDRDRFSYEALNGAERLTQPMIKRNGQWATVDWQEALSFTVERLKAVKTSNTANSIGALLAVHSTLEELYSLSKLMQGLGSANIDFRLRSQASSLDAGRKGALWLGRDIASLSSLQRVLIVGSFLRKDHPLFSARLRHAARKGAQINVIHVADDDLLMPVHGKAIVPPSGIEHALAEVAVAVAAQKGVAAPSALMSVQAGDEAQKIAKSLLGGERKAVLLGNLVANHADALQLLALAQWIADQTGASCGFFGDGANAVGGYVAGAVPGEGGMNAAAMLRQGMKAFILLHAEPEFDSAMGAEAIKAMHAADFVVALSPFKHAAQSYADVLLPISPYTETSGTFVNAEGRAQSFHGVVKPLGDTRPGWKVLRVLANLLGVPDFDYESSESIRNEALGTGDIVSQLSNATTMQIRTPKRASDAVERVADVPIYSSDAMVRRAPALQATADAQLSAVRVSPALWSAMGLNGSATLRIKQGEGVVTLSAVADARLAGKTIRLPSAHGLTAALGAEAALITVEKV
jgi:NADH-quinone oxidoreductase subunit G